MKNIYHKVVRETGSGLSVGIDEYGIKVSELTCIEGLIEDPEGAYLIITGHFSWNAYYNRNRCYGGDNGTGNMRERLVAGAISLLAYWGGEEGFIDNLNDFEEV